MKIVIVLISLLMIPLSLPAQRPMTLEEAFGTARSQSVTALQAKHKNNNRFTRY